MRCGVLAHFFYHTSWGEGIALRKKSPSTVNEKGELRIPYETCDDIPLVWYPLYWKAYQALGSAHVPYSHFAVGASVQLACGVLLGGANQENASYPCGHCAERSVLSRVSNEFPTEPIEKILLLARHEDSHQWVETPITPCGLCRQYIAELVRCQQGRTIAFFSVGSRYSLYLPDVMGLLPLSFNL